MGSDEIQALIDASFTDQHKVEIITNSAKVGVAPKTIGYAELKDEFTKTIDLGPGTNVQWNTSVKFIKNVTQITTLTFSDAKVGDAIILKIPPTAYTLNLPAGVDTNDLLDFDETKTNYIHLVCVEDQVGSEIYTATVKPR